MCRAHGIAHQRVAAGGGGDLSRALSAAWGLNRHSVVEVTTDRGTNVDLHKRMQVQVLRAVQAAYRLIICQPDPDRPNLLGSSLPLLAPPLHVHSLSWRRYSLPLTVPLTTPLDISNRSFGSRAGLILTARLSCDLDPRSGSERICVGVGEVAPLPGLHAETLEEAEQQLALVSELLRGATLPRAAALLGGRLGTWQRSALGFEPSRLHPSVRFGLEAALMAAVAEERGMPLADLLRAAPGLAAAASSSGLAGVKVNGLVARSSEPGGTEAAVAEAVRLVQDEKYKCLKVKVARR